MPKLAGFMDDAETDLLAFMGFPKDHRAKIHSTNLIERSSGSTVKSSAGPTSSASFPTRPRSRGSSAPSCSSRTTSGRFNAADR
jgi:hypothetical protein